MTFQQVWIWSLATQAAVKLVQLVFRLHMHIPQSSGSIHKGDVLEGWIM